MEASHPCICVYQAQAPYPEVQAGGRNQRYAEAILSNMSGDISEMTAVCRYFYDHLAAAGVPEVASVFHEISIVEMRHLEIFGVLAQQLGADPRLWCIRRGRRTWWSPDYIQYTRKLGPLIHSALRAEQRTIEKYEGQTRWIQDENVVANLRRIIQDEQIHVELLDSLSAAYGNGASRPGRW